MVAGLVEGDDAVDGVGAGEVLLALAVEGGLGEVGGRAVDGGLGEGAVTLLHRLPERGQRGKGPGREDGTTRNGSQHRHPTAKGKPYLYLHGHGEIGGKRRENTRVRPGQPELDLKAALVKDGLAANNNDTGQPRAIGTVQASLMGSEAV